MLEHYQLVKCFLPSTGKTRDTYTVDLFPKEITFPKTKTEDYLIQVTSDILYLLQEPPKSLPYLQYGDKTKNALIKLSKLLNQAATQPSLKTIPEEPQALKPITKETFLIQDTPVPIDNPVPVLPHIRPIIPTAPPKGQHYASPRVQYNPLPRVQASPMFFKPITYNQPNRHKSPYLDMTQMFFNMTTPKQHVLPVAHPRLVQTRQVPQYYYNQGKFFLQYDVQHIQALHHFSNPSVNHV